MRQLLYEMKTLQNKAVRHSSSNIRAFIFSAWMQNWVMVFIEICFHRIARYWVNCTLKPLILTSATLPTWIFLLSYSMGPSSIKWGYISVVGWHTLALAVIFNGKWNWRRLWKKLRCYQCFIFINLGMNQIELYWKIICYIGILLFCLPSCWSQSSANLFALFLHLYEIN